VLLDTSVLIDAERGGRALVLLGGDVALSLSVITLTEYWRGVERADTSTRRARRVAVYRRLTERMNVIDVDADIARSAASLWADLRRAGTSIPDFDLLIAATALARGLRVATMDLRHFPRIPDLELVDLGGE
jgi:predicted nucleic acid-binding protein